LVKKKKKSEKTENEGPGKNHKGALAEGGNAGDGGQGSAPI